MKTSASTDGKAAAQSAGLRYVNDSDSGITRTRAGKNFAYHNPAGRRVSDRATLARITRLAIPPAWTEVWICPQADGHIQATGRDARGRKQYRYHTDWRSARDETKYERMFAFGRALPRIRGQVARDIARRGLGREKVLATMVRLLEATLVRVGNDEYARDNGSFGLSTMKDKHAAVSGQRVQFRFKGKSGRHHRIELRDPRIARIVRAVQDLPGQDLFQYVDEQGRTRDIKSDDVNEYLRRIAGGEFSAKDFRTWAGTVLAAVMLQQCAKCTSKTKAKQNIVQAIAQVAAHLGNTPAVCRKCYIHPLVLESYLTGATVKLTRAAAAEFRTERPALSATERAVIAFLQQRSRRATPPSVLTALRRSVARRRPRGRARYGVSDGARAAAKSRTRRSRASGRRPPAG
ncbi:MAG TPA: DNA topoisomerase IB [Opitutaceae bacterium]|nr:DNA topoisomerase IB [Opitutaceae bacterium]